MMFLVVVDASSKWPEVITMHSTTASKTIEVLRAVFARNGLPEQLVSDNGQQFIAEEFQLFLKMNGVKHITSAPYHPATNGLAERFAQTMKQSLTSLTKGQGSTQTKLSRFLIKYRHTPHSKTGETPAALFMGRSLRTRLDLINQTSESTFFASKNSKRKQSPTVHVVKYVNYMSAKQWVQEITEGRRSGYQESSMLGQVLYHIKSKLHRIWSGGDT